MSATQTFTINVDSNDKTALDYLAQHSSLSRQALKQCMQKGCVWLERPRTGQANTAGFVQRLRRAKKILQPGETLHFYYDEAVLAMHTAPAQLVADLGDYSVWNKPTGMLSQGSKWGDHCTIYRWAEKHLTPERPAFIVHRLDRAANGLIILAHKKRVAAQFAKRFEQREIDKHYAVTVAGDFSQALTAGQSVVRIDEKIDDKTALSHAEFLNYDAAKQRSNLLMTIETGRKHQIRKHLAGLGYPVIGDRLYGNAAANQSGENLQLRAQTLRFICPVSQQPKQFTLGNEQAV